MWRHLSGNLSTASGDNPCTFASPVQRPLCFLNQSSIDQRFTTSYGPFTLAPGETKTVVVAYLLRRRSTPCSRISVFPTRAN